MKVSVLGSGSWGTALAWVFRQNAITTLFGRSSESIKTLRADNENKKYLPNVSLQDIHLSDNLQQSVSNQDLIVLATPMSALKSLTSTLKTHLDNNKRCCIMCVSKGMSIAEKQFSSEIVEGELGSNYDIVVLSGPSHAEEVVQRHPVNVVVASKKLSASQWVQKNFSTDCFRIYTNQDILGVEIGGAVKNIIAIAAGIAMGLGYGNSTIAALISRGIAEIIRFGKVFDANEKTFYGLSGLGDLIATCNSTYSRNRFVGEQLVQGKTWEQIKASMKMVAEGVYTTQSVLETARQKKIDMPITRAVHAVLFENVSPKQALFDLMNRNLKSE